MILHDPGREEAGLAALKNGFREGGVLGSLTEGAG